MDLQRGEAVLDRLEKEAANVAAVGALKKDFESLGARLVATVSSVEALDVKLADANSELLSTAESVRAALKELQQELDTLSRSIEARVRAQIHDATTQYEGLVRSEVRSIADRIDLNQREFKQLVDTLSSASKNNAESVAADIQASQRRYFKIVLVVLVISVLALGGLIAALNPGV